LVITGQSADLAPADGKLYALRDATATVQSIPLIASSIMSKKIVVGAQGIVLDVKVGDGAYMRTLGEARQLARTMVAIARQVGRKAVALLSDMNQPLGCAVGNALEVREAIDTLHGGGPSDFREHCLLVSAHMLVLAGLAVDIPTARGLAEEALRAGRAWEKFRAMVAAQGGEVRVIDEPDRLPAAAQVQAILSPRSGYLAGVNARRVGETAALLGAGRARKGDPVDHAVGVVIHHKVGDFVEEGAPLFTLHANDSARLEKAREILLAAHTWSEQPVEPRPINLGVVSEADLV
jgi:pyrimidine-nucleoside phosphorylase